MPPEPPKIFISYNQADRDWAEWIPGVIKRGGYQPIIQAWHFRPGEDFVLKMQQATTESDMTIAVLSEALTISRKGNGNLGLSTVSRETNSVSARGADRKSVEFI